MLPAASRAALAPSSTLLAMSSFGFATALSNGTDSERLTATWEHVSSCVGEGFELSHGQPVDEELSDGGDVAGRGRLDRPTPLGGGGDEGSATVAVAAHLLDQSRARPSGRSGATPGSSPSPATRRSRTVSDDRPPVP